VGWILINGGIYWHYEMLGARIQAMPNPPEELCREWVADGAKRVFGFFFGWFYAVVYYFIWRVPLGLIFRE
jgi:hypothetical protein